MRVLALDPGERVGWAVGNVCDADTDLYRKGELAIEDSGIAFLKDMARAVHRAVVTEDKYDVVIYETWRLRAAMARKFAGSDFPAVQFIGMVRLCCWLNPRVTLVTQGPSIKSTADSVMPRLYPEAQRIIDGAPKAHDDAHHTDAVRHLVHWHFTKYV